jgi:hypothetical protein
MLVPISTGQTPTPEMAQVTRSLSNENEGGLYEEERLPAYSKEPTEDGSEYGRPTATQTTKAPPPIDEPHPSDRLVLPTTHDPGYASEAVLRRGLQVPTKSRLLTSGFAYPSILAQCDINAEQWSNFTQEITKEAEMTSAQWTTTVGKGFGTAVVGGLIFGWLGVVPAIIVGHTVRKHNEEKNLSKARSSNVLPEIINRWNEAVFRPKGLMIRVDLPGETADLDTMDISMGRKGWGNGCGNQSSSTQSSRKQAWIEKKAAKREIGARWKAAKKGRIVILPLGQETSRLAAAMPTRGISPVDGSAPPYEPSPVAEQRTGAMESYPNEKGGYVEV